MTRTNVATPWTVLCDNEPFLRHPNAMKAYAARNIETWDVPARSPDLNPIEMFWGRCRRQLRLMDLDDLRRKRPPLTKPAYVSRIKALFASGRAQNVAQNFAGRLRRTCQEVVRKKGAAARN